MIGDRWVGGMSWRDCNIWFFTSINIEQEEQIYTRSWGGGDEVVLEWLDGESPRSSSSLSGVRPEA